MTVPLGERVVEVITDLGEGAKPRYKYGSGCIVRGRTVLTAAHVIAGARTVQIRPPDKKLRRAKIDLEFVGGAPGPDLALIDVDDQHIDLPAIELAAVDRDSPTAMPVEDCHAVGYPWFAETPSPSAMRDTVDARGHIPVLSKLAVGLLTVEVTSSPRPLPPERTALGESEWSGMSGAPVLASGCLLGVVCEHALREGQSAITAVPLSALEFDPKHPRWGPGLVNARDWWARLGVLGLSGLRRFPEYELRSEPAYPATATPRRMPQSLRITPGLYGTPDIPADPRKMTVTTLGGTLSGKTTFMLGAYAALSAGFRGFSLQAATLEDELHIARAWNEMADGGQLPPPTSSPRAYRLVFKDGPTPVALIDWEDYRGGAIFDRSDGPDVPRLRERIHASDSFYLTIDGAQLRESMNGNSSKVTRAARQMTLIVQSSALRGKISLPPLVILVTKADLLGGAKGEGQAQVQYEIVRALQDLLPWCFVPGARILICPVAVGHSDPDSKRSIDFTVSPYQVHKPILWSVLKFLQQQNEASLAKVIERLGYALMDNLT